MMKRIIGTSITVLTIMLLLMLGPIDFANPSKILTQTNAYGYGSSGGGGSGGGGGAFIPRPFQASTLPNGPVRTVPQAEITPTQRASTFFTPNLVQPIQLQPSLATARATTGSQTASSASTGFISRIFASFGNFINYLFHSIFG